MNTVTLPASAVRDVLKAAVPFAGKDTTLPMLCAVQLDTIDGYLVATATNRYVVGRFRAKLTEGEWAGPFLMTMADAKRFLAAAKDAAAVMLPCTLSVDEVGARMLSLHTEQATLNAAELDEEFPKVAHLLLLVLYVGGPVDAEAVDQLVRASGQQAAARNPYWARWGVTIIDPDGYRLVLSHRSWP